MDATPGRAASLPRTPGGFANQLRTVLLLGALSVVLVLIGGALGKAYLWLFTGLAVAMNVGA